MEPTKSNEHFYFGPIDTKVYDKRDILYRAINPTLTSFFGLANTVTLKYIRILTGVSGIRKSKSEIQVLRVAVMRHKTIAGIWKVARKCGENDRMASIE
jgi:hypothetical protein